MSNRQQTNKEPSVFLPSETGLRYVYDPVGFATEILNWTPDPRQIEALSHIGPRVVLNWARQCGKSTVAAVKALHTIATNPGCTVLLIGAVEKHLSEFLLKVDRFSDPRFGGSRTSNWAIGGGPIRRQPGQPFSRCFPNGSRIIGATTDQSARSATTRLVIFDEAGKVRDDVWEAALPTLATTDGDIWVVGTPKQDRGWYRDLWMNQRKNTDEDTIAAAEPQARAWFRSMYPASVNPRIRKSYLAEMRWLHGESKFRREFNCEFVQDGLSLLKTEDVDAIFRP